MSFSCRKSYIGQKNGDRSINKETRKRHRL